MPHCSDCTASFKNVAGLSIHLGRKHKKKEEHFCLGCKNGFEVVGLKSRKYCSKTCKWKSFELRYLKDKNPNFKGGSLVKDCEYCHKRFEVLRSESRRYSKYCSLSCAAKSSWEKRGLKWKTYAGHRFRSDLDVQYAKWLDSLKLTWFYEPKTFRFENDQFTPDFFVMEWNTYVSVIRRSDLRNQKRSEGFRKYYPNFELKVLNEIELNQITEESHG